MFIIYEFLVENIIGPKCLNASNLYMKNIYYFKNIQDMVT